MGRLFGVFGGALLLVLFLSAIDGGVAQRFPSKKFRDQMMNGTNAYNNIGSKLTQVLNEYKLQFGSATKLRDRFAKDR
jgi:hypothetical protein